MDRLDALLLQLADGELHSGAELARGLGLSRTAIWKRMQQLQSLGIGVESQAGRGYRLRRPLELLDRERILDALDARVRLRLDALDVFRIIDSTSDYLRQQPAPPTGRWRVAVAEYQTGGRGRRGRQWLSPFAAGICLSASWRFDTAPGDLSALGLAAGVAVREALVAAGVSNLRLKWPNDIVTAQGKLAGMLVDVEGEVGGPLRATIGIGVNVFAAPALDAVAARETSLAPVALATLMPGREISRNQLVAAVLNALYEALQRFGRDGFAPFAERWRQADHLLGESLTVQVGPRTLSGRGAGIGADGALLLEEAGELRAVTSGEVRVRTEP